MLTMNQTPDIDGKVIWIIRVNLDADGYLYFADTDDKISLSGVDFDGKVVFKDSISDIEKLVDVSQGGSIGQVGNFGFALARYTSYTGISNFINDLYPATSKPLLTSKTVDVGICWDGATLTSQITWLSQFYIEDYSFQTNRMDAFCIEYDELAGRDLPPFVIQDSFDDGISYYTSAPDESKGQAIPIIYGDFTTLNLEYEDFNLVPTVALSKGNSYKAACHICNTVQANSYLYEYLDPVETVMQLSVASPTAVNTRAGHSITLAARKEKILGRLKVIPRGYVSGGSDYENAIDDDSSTYATLAPNNTMKWTLNAKLSDAQFGLFNGVRADTAFIVLWDANGGSVDFQIKYWHLELGVYSSLVASATRSGTGYTETYAFGDGNYDYGSNPAKRDDVAHWTPNELEALELHILNLVTSAGSMRIKHIYFDFNNLTKYELSKLGITSLRDTASGSRNPRLAKRPEPINYIESNVYAYVKGMMFESWVD